MTVVDVHALLPDRGLDARLTVDQGEIVALLGPNGAGKSSLLATISGALHPAAGHVAVDGLTLSGPEVWVPPHRRVVSVLAQDPLLFPHLTAWQNVAFGLRARGEGCAAARATAHDWLARVDAAELAGVRPARLSGGQAQRVALARALAPQPRVLLLDEPFSALDIVAAARMRDLVTEHRAGRATILVTHQLADVQALADRVVVLRSGRVVEHGATTSVLTRPSDPFTAWLARGG